MSDEANPQEVPAPDAPPAPAPEPPPEPAQEVERPVMDMQQYSEEQAKQLLIERRETQK